MVSTWAWAMTCAAAQTMRIKASGIEGLIVGMYLSSENVRQTSVCRLLPDATDCEAGDKLKFVGHRFQYWRRTRPGAGRGSIPSSSLKGAHVMPAREPRTAPVRELKTQPRRELERARPAGAERLTNTLVWQAEGRVRYGFSSDYRYRSGQIEVEARHIADVENIEHFADETKVDFFLEAECLRHSDVLRIEVIAKLIIRRKRDRGILLTCCPRWGGELTGGR